MCDRADKGVPCLWHALQRSLPGVQLHVELPLLTVNWTQGRVLSDGTFTSKPDMRMDVVAKQRVHSLQEGKKELLLCAFEVCGDEHMHRPDVASRDQKKADFCAKVGLPIVWLHVHRNGQPNVEQWRLALQNAWMWGHLSHKVYV